MNQFLTFAKKYSSDENSAMDQIFELLRDKYPSLYAENETSWTFELGKPIDLHWYVDKNLPDYVKRLFDIELNDIPDFYQRHTVGDVEIVTSMFHSYALVAASHFISKHPEKSITSVIHIDDHTDLMPALSKENEGSFSLNQSEEILRRIEYGTIGMGNFLTTFVLHSEPGQIYHVKNDVKNSEKNLGSFDAWKLGVSSQHVNLGGHTFQETGVNKRLKEKGVRASSQWTYQLRTDLPTSLALGTCENVWLDIDLDFFSNRYNKDSDWEQLYTYNPPVIDVRQSLIKMRQDIMCASWIQQLAVLTVSYSPGFFPCEYFELAKYLLVDPLIDFISSR